MKAKLEFVGWTLFIGLILTGFGSCTYKVIADTKEHNSREYQLSCSDGVRNTFQSKWGERPYSYERSNRWGTPSGSYLQRGGETCMVYYRPKAVENQ